MKQTYRNRCCISGPQGKQLLNIPVLKGNSKQATKEVKIDYDTPWQQHHLKTLASCYNSSPFYEFFEAELTELLSRKETFLLDLNLKCHEFVMESIQMFVPKTRLTSVYEKDYEVAKDYRYLVNAKAQQSFDFEPYTQVFSERYGFIENLSVLDLLFAEGGNSLNYLETQSFPW